MSVRCLHWLSGEIYSVDLLQTIMSSNAELIASIEALLAKAKSYDVEKPNRLARVEMLGMVDALHYQLESPEEAMFRQLTNVMWPARDRTG
jgi:hypothetical protein